LWKESRASIFGDGLESLEGDFPLLVKILDARDRLSIQVHPPARVAGDLGGEPKTEMWYIADAQPGAVLYVGLRAGITRADFERGIAEGHTEEQVHRIEVSPGDFIFIPSGRLHAIGAGLLIYEIQQNSDTTYRVFDWNRVGLDGQPRELHVEESLQCIDFDDVEPGLSVKDGETLVSCSEFVVEEWDFGEGEQRDLIEGGRFSIVTVVDGRVRCGTRTFAAGDFFLAPACAEGDARILETGDESARVLVTRLG
jgi:mannose-6-phosphate isomerase